MIFQYQTEYKTKHQIMKNKLFWLFLDYDLKLHNCIMFFFTWIFGLRIYSLASLEVFRLLGLYILDVVGLSWIQHGNQKLLISIRKILLILRNFQNPLSPDFFKDVSFHVSFHAKFGYMGCCDFSINNPQNTCLVT